jgi:3-methyladenine DNA glycosylase AlkD
MDKQNAPMTSDEIIGYLKSLANAQNVAGMARYGISPHNTLGVSIPVLRDMARRRGKDHRLAQELWESNIHEARILAAYVDNPRQVTAEQMEKWALEFDSWDVCDQVCSNLFDRTPYAAQKAMEWSERDGEFIKRAGFVLMACLAVHDKKASDSLFESFLSLILKEATDERNFVKKAVNWALRQIGKRNRNLNVLAIQTAREIAGLDSRAARWIAADALRELTGEKAQSRLLARN